MLIIDPESRWSIQEIMEKLTKIRDQNRQPNDATAHYYAATPQTDSDAKPFPHVWDHDQSLLRDQISPNKQHSTHSDLAPSKRSGVYALHKGPDDPMDAVGSKCDTGQRRLANTLTGSNPSNEESTLQRDPRHRAHRHESPGMTIPSVRRRIISLEPESVCVPDQMPRLCQEHLVPDQILDPNRFPSENGHPDKSVLKETGNTNLFHGPRGSDAVSTPATSNLGTGESRLSMSSRAGGTPLGSEGSPELSRKSVDFHRGLERDMMKPRVLSRTAPMAGCLNGDNRPVPSQRGRTPGMDSPRRHRWSFRRIWRSLRTGCRPVLERCLVVGRRGHKGL